MTIAWTAVRIAGPGVRADADSAAVDGAVAGAAAAARGRSAARVT